jgi:hypothetical protein
LIYMSFKTKSTAVIAGLAIAAAASLTACGGGGDVAKSGADAAKAGADAAKAGADAAKAGADAAKAGAGMALAPVVTPVKTALVQANSAVKNGDMAKAKSQFEKFEGLWKTAEPQVKAAAGDKFPALEAGISKIKSVMGEAAPKKEAASEALTGVIKTLDGLVAAK